jgi:hypothetical protein
MLNPFLVEGDFVFYIIGYSFSGSCSTPSIMGRMAVDGLV